MRMCVYVHTCMCAFSYAHVCVPPCGGHSYSSFACLVVLLTNVD